MQCISCTCMVCMNEMSSLYHRRMRLSSHLTTLDCKCIVLQGLKKITSLVFSVNGQFIAMTLDVCDLTVIVIYVFQ